MLSAKQMANDVIEKYKDHNGVETPEDVNVSVFTRIVYEEVLLPLVSEVADNVKVAKKANHAEYSAIKDGSKKFSAVVHRLNTWMGDSVLNADSFLHMYANAVAEEGEHT